MIKNLSAGENWRVYHCATKATHNLQLNDTDAAGASSTPFNNTEPTASVFSVGTDGATNNNGDTIVAYLFAGKSFEDDAVQFDGGTQGLTLAATSDFHFGTDDFTIECFVKRNRDIGAYSRICHFGNFWQNNSAVGFNFDDGDHLDKLTFASEVINR